MQTHNAEIYGAASHTVLNTQVIKSGGVREGGGMKERKQRQREKKQRERRVLDKADVIFSKSTFLTTHGRAYCSEETEDNSEDPTKGENTGHR